jgi:hypothetical protein
MRNLDSCRCWRCTLCPCKVGNKFLVNFWNRTILVCIPCIKQILSVFKGIISALDTGEWWTSRCGRFTTRKNGQHLLNTNLSGPQMGTGRILEKRISLAHTEVWTADRPVPSLSQYSLSYPASLLYIKLFLIRLRKTFFGPLFDKWSRNVDTRWMI